jgi:hypothetical protein
MEAFWNRLWNGLVAVVLIGLVVAGGWFAIGKFGSSTGSGEPDRGGGAGGVEAPKLVRPDAVKALAQLNLNIIAREIHRLSGENPEELKSAELAVAHAHGVFTEKSRTEQNIPEHLEVQDEIVGLGKERSFAGMDGPKAADVLRREFEKVEANRPYFLHVRRAGNDLYLKIAFAEPAGLRQAKVALPARIKIPPATAQRVQKDVWQQPQFYQEMFLTAEERSRIHKILGESEASQADFSFLMDRVLGEFLREVQGERSYIAQRLKELGAAVKASAVMDVVLCHDGRRIEGSILDQKDGIVTLATSIDVHRLPLDQVAQVRKAVDIIAEFRALGGYALVQPVVLAKAFEYARAWGLDDHAQQLAFQVLERDPSSLQAREMAGFFKDEKGVWRPSTAGTGTAGAPLTRDDLRRKFEKAGYMLIDGKWHIQTPWTITVTSLHDGLNGVEGKTPPFKNPQVLATYKRVELVKRPEGQTPLQVFMDTRQQNPDRQMREWFIAPRPGQASGGALILKIMAPAPIAECRVKLAGFVIAGVDREVEGKVQLTVETEGGGSKPLYAIDRSSNSDLHDITALVKGRKMFAVAAAMETTMDKFGTYARVLQSLPDTKDPVFLVRGSVVKGAPEADRQWNAASPGGAGSGTKAGSNK